MSWRDPQDEFDHADRYIRVRLHCGAEAVMIALLWAAARLSAYLGRAEIHDQALADLKAQEAEELAAHRARVGRDRRGRSRRVQRGEISAQDGRNGSGRS